MKLGFTGTQNGMTVRQQAAVKSLIYKEGIHIEEFHHGDCVGADEEACKMVQDLISVWYHGDDTPTNKIIHCHPPDNKRARAYTKADVMHPTAPYLDRNHDIIDTTDTLIAAPNNMHQVLRSGTWATIRYARVAGHKIYIVFKDGTIEEEG